jgi:hypothetical protein
VSVRTDSPLAFAVGSLVGAVVTASMVVGADVFAYAMHWWGQR